MNRTRPWPIIIAMLAGAAAMVIVAAFAPQSAAAGWLIAFIFVSAIPLGSLTWMMIHRLTGGRWGEQLGPLLMPAAASLPLFALLLVPVLIALPVLYAWTGAGAAVAPDVARLYLNVPLFVVRAVIALVGWSVLGLALPRLNGRAGMLAPGLGLIFHALMISLVSVDWILSAKPSFISTSFGASIAFMQMQAALAFAALRATDDIDEQAVRDLGGLLLATTLGLTYINFMAVLVLWYGDLPHKIDFILQRIVTPWRWLAIAAFVFASVLPILALLLARVRASRGALRLVALSIFAGLACYVAWLLAPAYGAWALLTAALATLTLGAVLALAVGTLGRQMSFNRLGAEHD
jgi:hypothetical protein